MATTTNYGWDTPDDTDLVKDGAAAIRTLGSSVDTTTKALNPSTTEGDIEYRSATANTNTRLGIGTTGQVLTVTGGVPAWETAASAVPANDGATISTMQATSSTTYTDLVTVGPSVTVTTGTKVLVIIGAYIEASGGLSYMSFEISGATTSAASDTTSTGSNGGSALRAYYSRAQVVTVTAGSNTFTAKYRTWGGNRDFERRDIFVMALN
jgi:hypothetical protein